MKPSNVIKVLEVAISNRHNILLAGAPGVGKTDLVKQAAANVKCHIIITHPVVSDPTDFKGMPWVVVEKDGRPIARFVPFGHLIELVNGEEDLLFVFDDMGQAAPATQAACMQLLLARHLDDMKIRDNVTFFACTNRREDKAGVQGILEPVKSRFVSILNVDVDVEDWATWAIRAKLPFNVISFVRWRPNQLFSFKANRDMTNSPCPRTVHHACKILMAGYPKELEREMLMGAAGEAWASEWDAFRKYEEALPNINRIIQDPDKGEILAEAHMTYALCGALAERATEATFPNIIKYAIRFGERNEVKGQTLKGRPEFGIMLIKDCLLKDAKLRKNPAYIQWQLKHTDIIL